MPSRPSSRTQRAGVGEDRRVGDARAWRRSAAGPTYQGSRRKPCDWWPQRSACTRLSATRAASSVRDAEGGEHPRAERPAARPARSGATWRPPLASSCRCCIQYLHTTAREREDGDVQPDGADGGAARTARGVPRRHGRERGGLGAGRAGVPAVRRLLGRRRREPLRPLRALHRRRGVRGAQGRAALRAVARPSPSRSLVGQVNTPGALLATHTAEESA